MILKSQPTLKVGTASECRGDQVIVDELDKLDNHFS